MHSGLAEKDPLSHVRRDETDWGEFSKSAQALFSEYLLPLIVAYSPLFYWRLSLLPPRDSVPSFGSFWPFFAPKKAKRYQMRYQIFPPLSELKKWCSRSELNRDRPIRNRQLYPFELREQAVMCFRIPIRSALTSDLAMNRKGAPAYLNLFRKPFRDLDNCRTEVGGSSITAFQML